MELDRNGLEVLGRQECLGLLRTATVGRVGLSVHALPVVLPVSFVLHGDRLVVRTGAGSKLEAAMAGAVVAFEADEVDHQAGVAWSVLVRGSSTVVTDGLPGLAPPTGAWGPRWIDPADERLVVISTDLVSGRRLRDVPRAAALSAPGVPAT